MTPIDKEMARAAIHRMLDVPNQDPYLDVAEEMRHAVRKMYGQLLEGTTEELEAFWNKETEK